MLARKSLKHRFLIFVYVYFVTIKLRLQFITYSSLNVYHRFFFIIVFVLLSKYCSLYMCSFQRISICFLL